MNSPPEPPVRVPVSTPGDVIVVVPHLLGFHPQESLVILGLFGSSQRVRLAFRYDLPDPPDRDVAEAIGYHTAKHLRRQRLSTAMVIGCGPGTLVTPVVDAVRRILAIDRVRLQDALRVDEGRWWSYMCTEPSCCPPCGLPVPGNSHPAASALAQAGLPAAASRADLAATIAPIGGPDAEAINLATEQAVTTVADDLAQLGQDAVRTRCLDIVQGAITTYRNGGSITDPAQLARIAVALTSIEIRDDAWARMDPAHHAVHARLWTDLTCRACPGTVAAPAALLAFTAWQGGQGALANLALDRALADTPGYSMALLLRDALDAGAPPSAAVLPMTPEEVAASYDARRRR